MKTSSGRMPIRSFHSHRNIKSYSSDFFLTLLLLSIQTVSGFLHHPHFPLVHQYNPHVRLTMVPNNASSQRKYWKVWKTIDHLEQKGLRCDPALQNTETIRNLIKEVSNILRQLGNRWGDDDEWQGILNKSTLLHEVEESILALGFLMDFIKNGNDRQLKMGSKITIVDVCCGKGIFSMLASYIFQNETRVDKIIMLDKGEINWDHCHILNQCARDEGRPLIETWKCNLHDIDQVVDRFSNTMESPIVMIGIHLCKTLSPCFIGIANQLSLLCPFFILVPCCLPRAVLQSNIIGKKSVVRVLQYETMTEKNERYMAKSRRDAAMKRALLKRPVTMIDQASWIGEDKGKVSIPCWKCGNLGHFKVDCPSSQSTGKPQLLRPPEMEIDVSHVLNAEAPFDNYCNLLAQSIQYSSVRMVDAGLVNDSVLHQHQVENWNGSRKSIYIVATHKS